MCGQVGIIFGKKRRRIAEREYLNEVFIRMLLSSERRGPHASGVALLQTDGDFRLFKRPVRAHRIIREPDFREVMDEVNNRTTVLMGCQRHVLNATTWPRWRTRGSESNSRNNHPIRAGNIIGTHNGTIYNADQLFCRFQLPRYAEVDSELIFRLADCFTSAHGFNDAGFRKALRLCRGQMSAVLASRHDPRAITVLKGKCQRHNLKRHYVARSRCATAANTGRCSMPPRPSLSIADWRLATAERKMQRQPSVQIPNTFHIPKSKIRNWLVGANWKFLHSPC